MYKYLQISILHGRLAYIITGNDTAHPIEATKLEIIIITAPVVARFPEAMLGIRPTPLPESGIEDTTYKIIL